MIPGSLSLPTIVCLAFAQDQPSAEELFYRAFYLEIGLRDFAQAESAYANVEAAFAQKRPSHAALLTGSTPDVQPKELRVRALAGRARCLKALGRNDEAAAVVKAALALDPKNADVLALEEKTGAGEQQDVELEQRINSLIENLGGAARDTAVNDLWRVGDRAVPLLEKALRSRSVGIVSGAARVLGLIKSETACAVLARAFVDDRVLFPTVLVDELRAIQLDSSTQKVFAAALSRPEKELRIQAARITSGKSIPNQSSPTATLIPLFLRILRDPEHEVRATILFSLPDRDAAAGLSTRILELLRSNLEEDRLFALDFIGMNRDAMAAAAEPLQEMLQDRNRTVRVKALHDLIDVLSNADTQRASALSAQLLADPDFAVVVEAARGYHRSKSPERSAEIDANVLAVLRRAIEEPEATSQQRSEVLALIPSECVDIETAIDLFVRVGSPTSALSPNDRIGFRKEILITINRLLGRLRTIDSKSQALAPGFARVVDDPGRELWLQECVNQRNPPYELVETYLLATSLPNETIRKLGYSGLPDFRATRRDRAPPFLAQDLTSRDQEMRSAALGVTALVADPALAPALRSLLANGTQYERPPALQALVSCLGKEARNDLLQAMQDKQTESPGIAVRELARLFGTDATEDFVARMQADHDAGSIIDRMVASGSGQYVLQVPAEVLSAFVQRIPDDLVTSGLLYRVADFVPVDLLAHVIEAGLKSSKPETRQTTVLVAGKQHVESVELALVPLLDSADGKLRAAAVTSLQQIHDYRQLRRSLDTSSDAERRAAFTKAKALATSKDANERIVAALALGALGDVAAVPLLLDLATESDANVNAAARKALEKLGSSPVTPAAGSTKDSKDGAKQ